MGLDKVDFVYSLILLVFLLMALFSQRLRLATALRYGGGWLVIAFTIFLGYSYQPELKGVWQRLIGQLIPSKVIENADGSVSFNRSNNGHFQLKALIGNQTVEFMVDTGATRTVLTLEDAKRLGINVEKLVYNQPSLTANGITYSAAIRLPEIKIGSIIVYDVPAAVSKNLDGMSLLGMSFLEKLKGYRVENDRLTLIAPTFF